MSKFDLAFEDAMKVLLEKEYVNSTFEDNLRLLAKILKDNDYLPRDKDVEQTVKELLSQPNNVKEIALSTQDQSLPPFKLRIQQDSNSESFSITAINLKNPNEQKKFENSMLETIFDDVINYVKTTSLKQLSPDSALETLPPEQGANAQPGAEQSALAPK